MPGTRALEIYVELHKVCPPNFSQPFSNLVIGVFMVNEITHATPIIKLLHSNASSECVHFIVLMISEQCCHQFYCTCDLFIVMNKHAVKEFLYSILIKPETSPRL